MNRKIISLILLISVSILLLTACTGKTPDEIAKEETGKITLENVDWSFAVEGAEQNEYTLAEAKVHELSKLITTCIITNSDGTGESVAGSGPTSLRVDGVLLKEFLADVGRPDATGVTYYGYDVYGEEMSYTLTPDELENDTIVIGWICNIDKLLPDTTTYVGIFGPNASTTFVACTSLSKIVIE